MSITVYRYGTPSWVGVPPEVHEQLRLAHSLAQDLVSLEHRREQMIKGIWSSYPDVAAAEEQLAEAETAARELAEHLATDKSRERTRAPKTGTAAALSIVRAQAKVARVARRAAIAEVREDARARLMEVTVEHRAAIKALYADYMARGLYWATFNDVHDHHRSAVKRIGAIRAGGRPAALRHRRFDGSGSIAVQLQRQADDPPRTPALLASGTGQWRNVMRLTPWIDPDEFATLTRAEQRHAARGTVALNIGGGRVIELPVIVHRMLPPDADITGARLVARRVAGHLSWHLCVTAKLADPKPLTGGPSVAIHFGWRRTEDDGTLRVATWRSDTDLAIPAGLADAVRRTSTNSGVVYLSGTWRDVANRHTNLSSRRDTAFDGIKAELIGWLTLNPPGSTEHPDDDDERDWPTATDVTRWRSPGRIVAWAARFRDADDPTPGAALLATIETWRRADKHLWEQQANGRNKNLGRRDDAWSRVAAWLASTATRIILDDTVLTEIRADRDSPIPTEITVIPTQQRIDAAPGVLREAIRAAAVRDGVEVAVVSHTGMTRTHAECGHINPADERYAAAIEVTCDGCGRSYDQDHNATRLMLASAPTPPDPPDSARSSR